LTDDKKRISFQGRVWSGTERQLHWLTSLNGRITLKPVRQEKKPGEPFPWNVIGFLLLDDTGQMVSLLILMFVVFGVALILLG